MESNSDSKQLRTKKRQLLIIRCRSSTKRHLRMKKRVPITVENKKTVERKNNFPAGIVAIFLKNVFVFKDHGHLKRIILKGRGFRCGSDEKMMRMWFGLEIDVVGLPPLINPEPVSCLQRTHTCSELWLCTRQSASFLKCKQTRII